MEALDRKIIEQIAKNNKILERLYAEHSKLDVELATLSNRRFLTKREEQEIRALKVRKLQGVDKMMQIIQPYKEECSAA